MYSALSLRLVAHGGIQRSRSVFIIIIIFVVVVIIIIVVVVVVMMMMYKEVGKD